MQHSQIKIGNMPRGQRVASSPVPPVPPDFQAQLDALSARVDAQQATLDSQQTQITAQQGTIDAQQAQISDLQSQLAQKVSLAEVNQAIASGSASNVDGIDLCQGTISDPPQQPEVENIQNCLNNLMGALQH